MFSGAASAHLTGAADREFGSRLGRVSPKFSFLVIDKLSIKIDCELNIEGPA